MSVLLYIESYQMSLFINSLAGILKSVYRCCLKWLSY
ncbi:hypothetical protein AAEX37_01635 [Oligella sp. MSHR50489EDL]